jgi:hypothetical protein
MEQAEQPSICAQNHHLFPEYSLKSLMRSLQGKSDGSVAGIRACAANLVACLTQTSRAERVDAAGRALRELPNLVFDGFAELD